MLSRQSELPKPTIQSAPWGGRTTGARTRKHGRSAPRLMYARMVHDHGRQPQAQGPVRRPLGRVSSLASGGLQSVISTVFTGALRADRSECDRV